MPLVGIALGLFKLRAAYANMFNTAYRVYQLNQVPLSRTTSTTKLVSTTITVLVKHAKQNLNLKHTKHALLLPICSDLTNLTGPDLYKSDWCFVEHCLCHLAHPQNHFHISFITTTSVTVIIFSLKFLPL